MRDFRKIILAVLAIGFSVFLIQSSCHEENGLNGPEKPGGIGGVAMMQRPTSSPEQQASPTELARAQAPSERFEFNRAEGFNAGPRASGDSAANAAAGAATGERARTEEIQGSWVLVDPNQTKLELTIANDTGSVKEFRSEDEKGGAVEQNVRVISEGKTVWVVSSDPPSKARLTRGERPILLTFSFYGADAPRVVSVNGQERTPLKVLSHSR